MLRARVAVFIWLIPPLSWGATYYVHPTGGNNAKSCATATSSTPTNAKRSILAGIQCLKPGDTLRLHAEAYTDPAIFTDRPGQDIPNGTSYETATIIESFGGTVTWTYTDNSAIDFRNSDAYIIVRASKGSAFIVDGSTGNAGAANFAFRAGTHHVKLEGIENRRSHTSALFLLPGSASIWLTGVSSHENTGAAHGSYISGSGHLIENSRFERNPGLGLQLFDANAGGKTNTTIVRGNVFANNAKAGLAIDGDNNQIYRNEFIDNGANGIACGYAPGSSGTLIANNTIVGNKSDGIYLGHSGPCTAVTLQNNLIVGQAGRCINASPTHAVTGTIIATNCHANGNNTVAGGSAAITKTTALDPGFTNAGARDLTLRADSPLVSRGTTVSGMPHNGGAPEIGARETFDGAEPTPVQLK